MTKEGNLVTLVSLSGLNTALTFTEEHEPEKYRRMRQWIK